MDSQEQIDPRALSGKRILVVDDSDATRAVIGGILKKFGAEFYEAASGPEAMQLVKAMPFLLDAILLDLVMNDVDGFTTAEAISKWLPNGKSIIIPMGASISTKVTAELAAHGIEAKPLRKPYTPTQVLRAVLGVMGSQQISGKPLSEPQEAESRSRTQLLPAIDGIDTRGALERCLDDVQLLRRILLDCQATSRSGLFRAQEAVHASDFQSAYQLLHKFHGEFLNLGLTTLVDSLMKIQEQISDSVEEGVNPYLSSATAPTQRLQPINQRSSIARQIDELSNKVEQQLIRFLAIPAIRGLSPDFSVNSSSVKSVVDPSVFERILLSLQRHDTLAINLVNTVHRVMPLSYDDEVERLFRKHVESLDFELALSLVHEPDLPVNKNWEREKKPRILLVEKAQLTVRLLANILSEIADLRFARSSEEAMLLCGKWTPDLLLINVDLDETSGIDLCRNLKASGAMARVPVILMSSKNDVITEVLGLTAGAVDFIEMPIMPARVIGRIRGHLGSARPLPGDSPIRDGPVDALERISGFIVTDASRKLIAVSPDIVRFLGMKKQFLGGKLETLFRGAEAQRIETLHEESLNLGRSKSVQLYIANDSGEQLPLRISGRKITSEAGVIVWISCENDVDIVLERADETNKEVAKAVATLSGGIAHEFNNQLSVIIGSIDIAMDSKSHDEAKKPLQRARDAALRLAVTSRSMGEASIRRGLPAGLPERVDKLIERYWGVWKSVVPGNIAFTGTLGNEVSYIRMASDDFRWCVASLISNAVEAMPKGGELELRYYLSPSENPQRKGANDIVIDLKDSGVGMEPSILAKAMQPFFSTKPGHAGLGLSQLQWTLESTGGSVRLRGNPEGGVTASIRLPAAEG